jgi:hypothetical protein
MLERVLVSPLSLATAGPIVNVTRFDAVTAKFTVSASQAA